MAYTIHDYTLDRILIEDAVKAVWLAVDVRDWSRIPSLVHQDGLIVSSPSPTTVLPQASGRFVSCLESFSRLAK